MRPRYRMKMAARRLPKPWPQVQPGQIILSKRQQSLNTQNTGFRGLQATTPSTFGALPKQYFRSIGSERGLFEAVCMNKIQQVILKHITAKGGTSDFPNIYSALRDAGWVYLEDFEIDYELKGLVQDGKVTCNRGDYTLIEVKQ